MNLSRLHLILGPEWEEIYLDVDYLHAHEPPDEETEAAVAEHHHRQRGEGPHPARGCHQVSQAQLVSRVSRVKSFVLSMALLRQNYKADRNGSLLNNDASSG